eukprot:TRINITY_DN85_c2_g1_i5.p1 TRINITY_DN85_c2_g1~~TRINITY_DN85_c2_g1_i5.p1  ORF type:complete len:256 (-),score=-16.85 TRINITY_DN85_c2_g1_i5:133-849(-)
MLQNSILQYFFSIFKITKNASIFQHRKYRAIASGNCEIFNPLKYQKLDIMNNFIYENTKFWTRPIIANQQKKQLNVFFVEIRIEEIIEEFSAIYSNIFMFGRKLQMLKQLRISNCRFFSPINKFQAKKQLILRNLNVEKIFFSRTRFKNAHNLKLVKSARYLNFKLVFIFLNSNCEYPYSQNYQSILHILRSYILRFKQHNKYLSFDFIFCCSIFFFLQLYAQCYVGQEMSGLLLCNV